MHPLFHSENVEFRYRPFPIGSLTPVVDDAIYEEMLSNWPALELFQHMPKLGNKYTLGDAYHRKEFRRFIRETPIWSRFDEWISSQEFIETLMKCLVEHHIDVGFRSGTTWRKQTVKNIKAMLRGRSSNRGVRLKGTWEFQMIPAHGGYLLPHTDAPNKIVAMTLSMISPGEWDESWGGGIDIGVAKEDRRVYNQLNVQADFDEIDWVDGIAFRPNTGVLFVKTYDSWHAVRPIQGPDDGTMRRNLVINIRAR